MPGFGFQAKRITMLCVGQNCKVTANLVLPQAVFVVRDSSPSDARRQTGSSHDEL